LVSSQPQIGVLSERSFVSCFWLSAASQRKLTQAGWTSRGASLIGKPFSLLAIGLAIGWLE